MVAEYKVIIRIHLTTHLGAYHSIKTVKNDLLLDVKKTVFSMQNTIVLANLLNKDP